MATQFARRRKRMGWLMLTLLACSATLGCVERRLLIRSEPPGALVKIDDEEIGVTPVSTSFVYYGTRKIQLVKDGYETLTLLQPIPAPWYEQPGADFFSENAVPNKLRDMRVLDYQLKPAAMVPTNELLDRARSLRRNAQALEPAIEIPPRVAPGPPARPNPPPQPSFQPLPPSLPPPLSPPPAGTSAVPPQGGAPPPSVVPWVQPGAQPDSSFERLPR